MLFLDGLGSSSLVDASGANADPDNHGVRDAFQRTAVRLLQDAPTAQAVFFSYRAGAILAQQGDPLGGWSGGAYAGGAEPVYGPSDVTDVRLKYQIAALDWLVSGLHDGQPTAQVDLIGFGLGGVVALAWVASRRKAKDETRTKHLAAIRRVVLADAFVGGLNPELPFAPGGIAGLGWSKLDLGRGEVVKDLLAHGRTIRGLASAIKQVDAAAVESRGDCLVNGRRVPGFETWLGKGAGGLVPDERLARLDLPAVDGDLAATHRQILVSDDPGAAQGRDAIARFLGA